MYLQRPNETTGRSRFLLALSLSTVTAFAVAAPLAFKAIAPDTNSPMGGDNVVDEIQEESTTTTTPLPVGPRIGPKVRSPQAKLPIAPGNPSDLTYSVDSTAKAPVPTTRPPATSTTATTDATSASTTTSTSSTSSTSPSSSTSSSTTTSSTTATTQPDSSSTVGT